MDSARGMCPRHPTCTVTRASDMTALALLSRHDVVVMLHGGGWTSELRSNRWHYAKFFSQRLAVVIAQGGGAHSGSVSTEDRLPNTSVLEIGGLRPLLDDPDQSADVLQQYLRERGFRRPLLWISNPLTWNTAAALPSWPTVFHATEDFFAVARFNRLISSSYLEACALACAEQADAILACSQGVADSIAMHTGRTDIVATTNGVALDDYGPLAPTRPVDVSPADLARSFVFAGNVNKRLDLALIRRLALEMPGHLVLLVGPVSFPPREAAEFARLVALPNVIHRGTMSTPELNHLYRNCLLGIIPYTDEDVIVRAGFPLKTLEMLAAGLPVVTSHMDATHGIDDLVMCSHSHEEFVQLCASSAAHTTLPPTVRNATPSPVAAAFAYERLIPAALDQLCTVLDTAVPRSRARARLSLPRLVVDAAISARSVGASGLLRGVARLLRPRRT